MNRIRLLIAGLALCGSVAGVAVVNEEEPAAANGGGVILCDHPTYHPTNPAGASPHQPTGTMLGSVAGPHPGPIIVVTGNDGAVWYLQAHAHATPFPHWQWDSAWVRIGGGTNFRPKVFVTSDGVVRIRVIGLDGNTWETHGQNNGTTGFRSWYQWQSNGTSGYDTAPTNVAWNIGQSKWDVINYGGILSRCS